MAESRALAESDMWKRKPFPYFQESSVKNCLASIFCKPIFEANWYSSDYLRRFLWPLAGSLHMVEKWCMKCVAPLSFGAQAAKKKLSSKALDLTRVAASRLAILRTWALTVLQKACQDPGFV
ncbi:hypothetical protein H1C71_040564 [Ictidomys tridecemlineatus]|nr:hypothetical protein H1C71_040564 [Ictidomys tridecemlineatus]